MARVFPVLLTAALMSLSSAAMAVPFKWTVADLNFSIGGASLTGSFVFDAAVGGSAGYSDVDLTLSGAGAPSDGVYDAVSSFSGVDGGFLIAFMSGIGGSTSDPAVALFFTPDLSDSGAPVAVDSFAFGSCAPTAGNQCDDSIVAANQQFQPDGSATSERLTLAAPAPGMAALLGFAIVGLGMLRRTR